VNKEDREIFGKTQQKTPCQQVVPLSAGLWLAGRLSTSSNEGTDTPLSNMDEAADRMLTLKPR
jgi:hypothetical protein